MNRFEMKDKLLEFMSAEMLLDELCHAMSEKEGKENFDHIATMHDIELESDE